MRMFTQYKRENPDTILGEKLTIIQTYSSFNKDEIDELEQKCKENIGNGIVVETEGIKETDG